MKLGGSYFYAQDKLHREDGPAVILDTGETYWYWYGCEFKLGKFDPRWSAAHKAWRMRLKMEGAT